MVKLRVLQKKKKHDINDCKRDFYISTYNIISECFKSSSFTRPVKAMWFQGRVQGLEKEGVLIRNSLNSIERSKKAILIFNDPLLLRSKLDFFLNTSILEQSVQNTLLQSLKRKRNAFIKKYFFFQIF